MLLRVCPPMLVKSPPAKILPSACTAIAMDITVRVRIERIRQTGRGIEPGDIIARLSTDSDPSFAKSAADQNLAVRLHGDCIDTIVRVRVESSVERAVRVQPGNVVARHAENAGKSRRR